MAEIFTIGFTKKTARQFFERLRSAGVRTVIDTRLNNSGQLAGFSKKQDLEYFADQLLGAKYLHWADAAPTEQMLTAYKSGELNWEKYEAAYRRLIESRRIQDSIFARKLDGACLLCSEDKPEHCHRRILAEYLAERLPERLLIHHL